MVMLRSIFPILLWNTEESQSSILGTLQIETQAGMTNVENRICELPSIFSVALAILE